MRARSTAKQKKYNKSDSYAFYPSMELELFSSLSKRGTNSQQEDKIKTRLRCAIKAECVQNGISFSTYLQLFPRSTRNSMFLLGGQIGRILLSRDVEVELSTMTPLIWHYEAFHIARCVNWIGNSDSRKKAKRREENRNSVTLSQQQQRRYGPCRSKLEIKDEVRLAKPEKHKNKSRLLSRDGLINELRRREKKAGKVWRNMAWNTEEWATMQNENKNIHLGPDEVSHRAILLPHTTNCRTRCVGLLWIYFHYFICSLTIYYHHLSCSAKIFAN